MRLIIQLHTFVCLATTFVSIAFGQETRKLLTVSVDQARDLIEQQKILLDLGGLTTLTPDVAAVLSKHEGHLSLAGLKTLAVNTAAELAKHKGHGLDLNGLTVLSPEVAAELAKYDGQFLNLGGLTTVTPEAAAALAKREKPVWLAGITTLTPEAATELAKCQRDLWLTGLKTLKPEVAVELAKYTGLHLNLSGLTSLTPEIAQELASYEGTLYFDGLTTISPEAAAKLAKSKGTLSLNGVTTISLESATALAKCNTALVLMRLNFISLDVEQAFKQYQGRGLQLGEPSPGRKGKVRSKIISKVFVNSDGQLEVGGTNDLLIVNEKEGVVLKVGHIDRATQQSSLRYIAYPIEKEAKPELKVVEELSPGCYWNRRTDRLGAPKIHTILEMETFEVAAGPFRGWLIQKSENGNLATINENRNPKLERFINQTTGYINLSDGK